MHLPSLDYEPNLSQTRSFHPGDRRVLPLAFDGFGHHGNRGALKQFPRRDLGRERRSYPQQDRHRHNGVSTKLQERVFDAHLIDPQHLRPDAPHLPFHRAKAALLRAERAASGFEGLVKYEQGIHFSDPE